MLPHTASRLLAVVAPLSRLDVGARYPRSAWPAHLTLAPNFHVDMSPTRFLSSVRAVCVGIEPMKIRFDGAALFGPEQDVPVQVVDSAEVVAMHVRLADALEAYPGFAAAEPMYWRAGYRPHVTHVAALSTPQGSEAALEHVAVAELDGADATVVGGFPLGAG